MEKLTNQAVIDHQLIQMIRSRLDQGKEVVITVNGRSMLPLLKPDDKILLESVQPNHLIRGDIITIDCGSDLLTHRFWGYLENAEQVLTRGDQQFTFDPPHTFKQIVGRVTRRQRGNLNLQQGIGHRLNDYLKWVLTLSYKLEIIIRKDTDQTPTTILHRLLSRLIRYMTVGATTWVTKVVDLLPT